MKFNNMLLGGLAALTWLWSSLACASPLAPDLSELVKSLNPQDPVDIIITLNTKADLSAIIKEPDERKRRSLTIHALRAQALRTQSQLRRFLALNGVTRIEQLWLSNSIATTVPVSLLDALSLKPEIESIRLDAKVQGPAQRTPVQIDPASAIKLDAAVVDATSLAPPGWNGTAIRANELWSLGYSGQGVTVAIMDTGVDPNHADIQAAYRGGSNSWFDPSAEHSTPTDVNGHGTQVAGLILGGDASGETIGVAPGAEWIAVKIFNDAGVSTLSVIHSGFQWILDPDGNPDTNDTPDIVNNSWNLQNSVNTCNVEFQSDLQLLQALGVAVVFSAGNSGPTAATSESPANNPEAMAVGSLDDALNIANTSSRGPSACGGGVYPQVAAPGVYVYTSDLTFGGLFPDSYVTVSGTSFAAPHLSGAIALLKSTNLSLSSDQIISAIYSGALDLGSSGADNDYGWGMLDVAEAHNVLTGGVSVTAAPVANPDSLSTAEDTAGAFNPTSNDTADTSVDPANAIDPATLTITVQPVNGSLTLDTAGNVTYTPNANFNGTDQFSYTVTDTGGRTSNPALVSITVTAVNDAPSALADSFTVVEGSGANTFSAPGVLANDVDIDGDALTATGLDVTGTIGTVVLNADGSFTYTPEAGMTSGSSTTFSYLASDGVLTALATVTINIAGVPAPLANADSLITSEDTAGSVNVTANDSADAATALDPSTVTFVSAPQHGSVAKDALGNVTYTPVANFNGADQFSYTVNDQLGKTSNTAIVNIMITAVNDAPAPANDAYSTVIGAVLIVAAPGVLANDTDIDGDTLTTTGTVSGAAGTVLLNTDGSFSYTPAAGATPGSVDTFTYTVSDGLATRNASVSVTIGANPAPVANADSLTTLEDSATSVNVIQNDSADTATTIDPNSVSIVTPPQKGSVSVDTAGNVTYTPIANVNGADQFTYTVMDLLGRVSNEATVSVVISAVNDAPVANGDSYQATEGSTLTVAAPGVLANDSDIDSAQLTTTGVATGAAGGVILNADGSFAYTPAAGSGGTTDVFTYTVTDGVLTNTATVTITINAPPPVSNLPPEAQDDKINYSRRANNNGPMTFDISALLANDVDPDDTAFPSGASLQLVGGTAKSGSSIMNNSDGTLTYTPPASGSSDEFSYQAIDAQGGVSNTAKVTIRIRR